MPTPEPLVVAPGARPPVFLDGDCEAMLPAGKVAEVMGRPAALDDSGEPQDYDSVAGAGALSCVWWTDNVDVLRVAVFSADSVSEVDLETIDDWRQDPDCDWYCTAIRTQDGYVVVTTVNVPDEALERSQHEETVRVADLLTPVAVANVSATDTPWVRDRAGWLDVDCEDLASRTGAGLGRSFAGENWGIYIDPPLTVGLVADAAARYWVCKLVDPAGTYIEIEGYAGAAWGVEISEPSAVLPRPWKGEAAGEGLRNDGTSAIGWVMTDGANVVRITGIPAELGLSVEDVAAAVGAALTS